MIHGAISWIVLKTNSQEWYWDVDSQEAVQGRQAVGSLLTRSNFNSVWNVLNCPHNEMKLKQNSLKTVLKLFWHCFVSVSFRCADSFSGISNRGSMTDIQTLCLTVTLRHLLDYLIKSVATKRVHWVTRDLQCTLSIPTLPQLFPTWIPFFVSFCPPDSSSLL